MAEFIDDLSTYCDEITNDDVFQIIISSNVAKINLVYNLITAELENLKIAHDNVSDNSNRILNYVFDPYNNWVINHHIQRLMSFTFAEKRYIEG